MTVLTKRMEKITAYIDESGNSGIKIFSGHDKFHWVGVMLSSREADSTHSRISELVKSEGFDELHAGELGLTRINRLADEFISLYEELDVQFVFTRVEREHVATMKFMDLVFDPENNNAVPSAMYNKEFYRLVTIYSMAKTLTTDHRKRFWDAVSLGEKGVVKFVELMNDLKRHIIDNDQYIQDVGLFTEIFNYAASHPIKILELDILSSAQKRIRTEGMADASEDVFINHAKYRSANVAAFNMTIDSLHRILMDKGQIITKVVHDEQTEFDKQLKNAFEHISKVTIVSNPFEFPKAKTMDTFSGNIEFVKSSQNAGVQLIDLALWMMKKVNDSGVQLTDKCAELFQMINRRGCYTGFWLERLTVVLSQMIQEMDNYQGRR
ncbi:DUF3800 domain-containing protein [Paenibacillus timonensis]|uniref:DUF3800 domain-containing protein n=1 Tax=Paenibacillus timonensis TaxID=225915 RepID=A0ABW3S9G7_9BACL|nr:DUF3800 domain-containing protein [Paenibacillus timonensis]MCH1638932.1 DUF3800 domain-containing protein [Paenibacillus timonensis]